MYKRRWPSAETASLAVPVGAACDLLVEDGGTGRQDEEGSIGVHVMGRALAFGVMVLTAVGAAGAQQRARPAPPAGAASYRERCAECHGADARGVAGHDLTALWGAGASDDQVFRTIREGVPGTIMPPSTAPDEDLRAIVSYLRSLGDSVSLASAGDDTSRGEQIFRASCSGCHRVNRRGGRLGPDLSRIAEREAPEALTAAIRTPNASIPNGYRAVTLVTRDGRRIRGARKSEDAFSIQIMDTREQLQGYLKSTLLEVIREEASLMPPYPPERLSEVELNELLRFLSTLRASGPASR
ncbi:MAG: c-type cytochrome [Gemmatimonadetes bacterium]|nr:c-type cytochrome [Gemmatimonadota bacterium]